ncbi:hypothetical protein chiPu_0001674 [Chiloscyllium punctatum]|uniref:Uncharacterized protein n=1 Tax=Chiloscyllium punctatum TaxID=137246 RepID=A0A401RYW7_CHIPU|nr:hypothetical protein [Chiloscyllium punctatum]
MNHSGHREIPGLCTCLDSGELKQGVLNNHRVGPPKTDITVDMTQFINLPREAAGTGGALPMIKQPHTEVNFPGRSRKLQQEQRAGVSLPEHSVFSLPHRHVVHGFGEVAFAAADRLSCGHKEK